MEKLFSLKLSGKEEHNKSLSQSVEEHLKKLDEITRELDVKKRCAEDLKFKCDSSEVTLEKLKKEKLEIDKEHTNFVRDAAKREAELIKAAENAKQSEQVLKEQTQLLKDSVDKANHQLNCMKSKYTETSKLYERNEREMMSISEQLEKLQKQLLDKEQQLRHTIDTINQITNEKNKYKTDIKQCEAKLEKKSHEFGSLQIKMNELKGAEEDFKCQIIALTKTLEEKASVLARMFEAEQQRKSQWESELKDKAVRIEELENSLSNSQAEMNKIADTVDLKQKLINEKDLELQKLHDEFGKLSASQDSVRENNKELQTKCLDMATKLDQSLQAFHDKCCEFQNSEKYFQEQYSSLKEEIRQKMDEKEQLLNQMKKLEESIEALQQTKTRNEANMTMMIEENENLLSEKNELSRKLNETDFQLKELNGKYTLLSNQNDELTSIIDAKEKEVKKLKDERVKVEQDNHIRENELKCSVQELTTKAKELETEMVTLANQKEYFEKGKEKVEEEYRVISKELADISVFYETVKSECDQLAADMETSKLKLEENAGLLQSKESTVQQMSVQLETLCDDLQIKTKTYEDLLTERNLIKNQLEVNEEDLEHVNASFVQKQSELDSLTTEFSSKIDNLGSLLDEKNVEIEELQATITMLEQKLDRLNALLQEKDAELKSMCDEIFEHKEQLKTAHADTERLNNEKGVIELQLHTCVSDLEQKMIVIAEKDELLEKQKHESMRYCNEIMEQLNNKDKEVVLCQEKINMFEENLHHVESSLAEKEDELDLASQKVQELIIEVDEKYKYVEQKDNKIQELETAFTELTEQHLHMLTMKAQSEQTVQEVEGKLKESQDENNELHENIEVMKSDIENFDAVLEKCKNDLEQKIGECESLLSRLDCASNELQNASHDLQNKQEELDSAQKQVARLKEEKVFAESMLVSSEERFSKSEKERMGLLREKVELEQIIVCRDSTLEEYETHEFKITQEMEKLNMTNSEMLNVKDEEIQCLQNEIKTFEEKILSQHTEIDEMQVNQENERKKLDKFISLQELKKCEAEKEISYLKTQLQVVNGQLGEKEENLNDMLNQVEETDELVMNLKLENEALSKKLSEEETCFRKELSHTQEMLNKKQGQMKALLESNDSLQNKVVMYAAQIDSLQSKINHDQCLFTQKSKTWKEKIVNLKCSLTEKSKELDSAFEELQNSRAANKMESNALQTKNIELQDELNIYKHASENMKEEVEKQENLLTGKVKEIESVYEELNQIKLSYENEQNTLKSEISDLQNSLNSCKKEHEEGISTLKSECEIQVNELSNNVQNTTMELTALRSVHKTALREAEKVIEEHHIEVTKLSAEILEHEATIETLQGDLQKSEENLNMMKTDYEHEILHVQNALKLKEEEVTDALKNNKELITKYDALTDEVETKVKLFEEMLANKNEEALILQSTAEEKIVHLTEENRSLRSNTADLEKCFETKSQDLKNCLLKTEYDLKEKTEAVEKLESELKDIYDDKDQRDKDYECERLQFQQEIENLKKAKNEVEIQFETTREDQQKLQEKYNKLCVTHDEMDSTLFEMNKQIETILHEKQAEMESLLEKYEAEKTEFETEKQNSMRELKSTLEDTQSTRNTLITELDNMKISLEAKESAINEFKTKLEESNVEKQMLKDELLVTFNTLEKKLEIRNMEFEEKVSFLNTLEREAEDFKTQTSQLSSLYSRLQAQIEEERLTHSEEKKLVEENFKVLKEDCQMKEDLLNKAQMDRLESEETNKELKSCVETLTETVKSMEKVNEEKAKLRERVEELDHSNANVNEMLDTAVLDIKSLNTELEYVRLEKKEIKAKCSEHMQNELELKMKIEKEVENVKILNDQLQCLEEKGTLMLMENETLMLQLKELNTENEKKQSENEILEHEIILLGKKLQEKEENIESTVSKLTDMTNQKQEMEEQLQQVEGKCQELGEKVNEIEDLVNEERNGKKAADVLVESCHSEIENLKSDIKSHIEKIESLENDICAKDTEIRNLQGDKKKLTNDLSEIQSLYNNEKDKFVLKMQTLAEEMEKLQVCIIEKEHIIADLQSVREKSDSSYLAQINQLNNEITLLQSYRNELQDSLASSEERCMRNAEQHMEVKLKTEEDLKIQEDENKKLKAHMEYVEKTNSEMSESLEEFKTSLNILKEDVDKLSKQKEVWNKKNEMMMQELEEKNNSLHKVTLQNQEFNEKLKNVTNEKDGLNKDLKNEIEDLKLKLGDVTNQYKMMTSKNEEVEKQMEEVEKLVEDLHLEKQIEAEKQSTLESDIDELKNKLEQTEKTLEAQVESATNLSKSVVQAEEEISGLKTREEEIIETKLKLGKELQAAKLMIEKYGREAVATEEKMGSLNEIKLKMEKESEENLESLKYIKTVKEELSKELQDVWKKLENEHKNRVELLNETKSKEQVMKKLEKELNTAHESLDYANTVKHEVDAQLKSESTELHNMLNKLELEKEAFGQEVTDFKTQIKKLTEKIHECEEQKQFFECEMKKLKVCFDTLNHENEANIKELEMRQAAIEKLKDTLQVKSKELRKTEDAYGNERENNICSKAEILSLNANLADMKENIEKEKRKVKKFQHDVEKKNISITELEQELQSQHTLFSDKENKLQEMFNKLEETEKLRSFEKEMSRSKQIKLNEIKKSLLRSRSPSSINKSFNDSLVNLDDSIDCNSQILKLQEQITMMEKEKKKCIEAAVVEEKTRIVEASKQFVLDREKENEAQNKDLVDEIQLKDKKIENLQNKIMQHEDQCKQYEYTLEQEKKIYNELLKTSEEQNMTTENSNGVNDKNVYSGDEVREWQERYENMQQQNEELRTDFTKMVDDYERAKTKEKQELDKIKCHCEKLKNMCENKDIELKRLQAVAKEPMRNEKLLEDLREELRKSDEKYVEMEFKNEDFENVKKSNNKKHEKEISDLNKKITSLINDNEQLRKRLEETLAQLSLFEKENIKMNEELSSHPFQKNNLISPLTHSLSSLKVLSSEDEGLSSIAASQNPTFLSDVAKDGSAGAFVTPNRAKGILKKSSETPKRYMDSTEGYSSKTKRFRLNTVVEEVQSKISPNPSGIATRRRSARLAHKPYNREVPSSSSDEEVLIKQLSDSGSSHPTKENPVNSTLNRATYNDGIPLSPKKMNAPISTTKKLACDLGMPTQAATNKDALSKGSGPKRSTRTSSNGGVKDMNSTVTDTNVRKPLRSQSNTEEEKCNMQ